MPGSSIGSISRSAYRLLSFLLSFAIAILSIMGIFVQHDIAYADEFGVYSFICNDGSETSLAIKVGEDAPTSYGTVTKSYLDVDLKTVNKATGWPWAASAEKVDRESVKKVVVEDGVALTYFQNMFGAFTNATDFDLRGLDTTGYALPDGCDVPSFYKEKGAPALIKADVFPGQPIMGTYTSSRWGKIHSIQLGDKWTIPYLHNTFANVSTYIDLYFIADGEVKTFSSVGLYNTGEGDLLKPGITLYTSKGDALAELGSNVSLQSCEVSLTGKAVTGDETNGFSIPVMTTGFNPSSDPKNFNLDYKMSLSLTKDGQVVDRDQYALVLNKRQCRQPWFAV